MNEQEQAKQERGEKVEEKQGGEERGGRKGDKLTSLRSEILELLAVIILRPQLASSDFGRAEP